VRQLFAGGVRLRGQAVACPAILANGTETEHEFRRSARGVWHHPLQHEQQQSFAKAPRLNGKGAKEDKHRHAKGCEMRAIGGKHWRKRAADMRKLTLISVLLFAASPAAAQSTHQPLGAGGQTNTSSLPNTGVICEEEITATFCNVPTSPNTGGYGSSGGSPGSGPSAGSAGSIKSIPPCAAAEWPPNELCN